jgi:hypothetical protein
VQASPAGDDESWKERVMPQFAVLIYNHDSAHALDSTPEDRESCDEHAEELSSADAVLVAYALTPRALATSLRAGSTISEPFVPDGPIVAGFYVIESPDLDTALAIAGTNPVLHEGGGVEVRPVHSGGVVRQPRA